MTAPALTKGPIATSASPSLPLPPEQDRASSVLRQELTSALLLDLRAHYRAWLNKQRLTKPPVARTQRNYAHFRSLTLEQLRQWADEIKPETFEAAPATQESLHISDYSRACYKAWQAPLKEQDPFALELVKAAINRALEQSFPLESLSQLRPGILPAFDFAIVSTRVEQLETLLQKAPDNKRYWNLLHASTCFLNKLGYAAAGKWYAPEQAGDLSMEISERVLGPSAATTFLGKRDAECLVELLQEGHGTGLDGQDIIRPFLRHWFLQLTRLAEANADIEMYLEGGSNLHRIRVQSLSAGAASVLTNLLQGMSRPYLALPLKTSSTKIPTISAEEIRALAIAMIERQNQRMGTKASEMPKTFGQPRNVAD